MIWFSSDMHFGHANIIRLTKRPFKDLDEMHRELKARWNSKVQPDDTIYIVGDFSFMQLTENIKLLKQLNGKKHLIVGNHDKLKKLPLDEFESVQERLPFSLFQNNDTLLCHYPFLNTPDEVDHAAKNGYEIRFLDRRPKNEGQILIHGHMHNNGYKVKGRAINMSVEQWDYYPVSIDEVKAALKPDVE